MATVAMNVTLRGPTASINATAEVFPAHVISDAIAALAVTPDPVRVGLTVPEPTVTLTPPKRPRARRIAIVPNAQLRQEARESIEHAIGVLKQLELRTLERALADEYLVPELLYMLKVIDLRTEAVHEVLSDLRRDIETARGRLERLRDVFARIGLEGVYDALGDATVELGKVLITIRLP